VKSRLSRAMERLREAAAEVGLTLDEEVAP
jgi:hypothetical protein